MARRFHEETLSALQMRGQDFYRQKQYEAALQCFNEMLVRARSDPPYLS